MALSQALLNTMASTAFQALGALVETVTYYHKATMSSTPVASSVQGRFEQYRQHEIDLLAILRNDKKFRVQSTGLGFVPTLQDEVVRNDGTRWRVLNWEGGPGYPFYLMQTRELGTG